MNAGVMGPPQHFYRDHYPTSSSSSSATVGAASSPALPNMDTRRSSFPPRSGPIPYLSTPNVDDPNGPAHMSSPSPIHMGSRMHGGGGGDSIGVAELSSSGNAGISSQVIGKGMDIPGLGMGSMGTGTGTTTSTTTTVTPTTLQAENERLKEQVGHLNQELMNMKRRETNLVLRLSQRETEIQALISELQEQARQINPELIMMKRKLVDPSIGILFKAMKKEVEEKNQKIEELERELQGVQFTPSSVTGKRLVSKIKALQLENDELGKMLHQGKVEHLQVEISLHKKTIDQLKKSIEESDRFVVDLDAEIESMQSVIFNQQAKIDCEVTFVRNNNNTSTTTTVRSNII
ncbi:hypothetical protein HK102_011239 [Quaeritorhiza haematococci]|nr:hypothetical protein HK102_011239 [Quaeritorhiza haematococci]